MSVLNKYFGKDLVATICFNRNFGYEENSLIYVYPYYMITKDGLERVDSDYFPTRGSFEVRLSGGVTVQSILEQYGEIVTVRINSEPTNNLRGSNIYSFRFNPEFGKTRSELWIDVFENNSLYQIVEVNQTYASVEKTHKANNISDFIYTKQILIRDNYKLYGPFECQRDKDNSNDLILSAPRINDFYVGEYSYYDVEDHIVDVKDQNENICAEFISKEHITAPKNKMKHFDWIPDEYLVDVFVDIMRTEYGYNRDMLRQVKDLASNIDNNHDLSNLSPARIIKLKSLAKQVALQQLIFNDNLSSIINDESLLKGMIAKLSLEQEQLDKTREEYAQLQKQAANYEQKETKDNKDNSKDSESESFADMFSLSEGTKIVKTNNEPKKAAPVKTSTLKDMLDKLFHSKKSSQNFFDNMQLNNDSELANKNEEPEDETPLEDNDKTWPAHLSAPNINTKIPPQVLNRAFQRKLQATSGELFRITELTQKKESLEQENKKLKAKVELVKSVEELKKEKDSLDKTISNLKSSISDLEAVIAQKNKENEGIQAQLESKFAEFNDRANVAAKVLENQLLEKIISSVGAVTYKLDNSSNQANISINTNNNDALENKSTIEPASVVKDKKKDKSEVFDTSLLNKPMSPREMIERVYGVIKGKGHRNVSYNDVANYLICLNQGFITTLAGEPGTGKTSLCTLLAKALGLARNDSSRRFVEIAVERGWTSHKDFIGYYNPLTKTMEKSNVEAFNAFERMSEECESYDEMKVAPYIVLLDEANLSPMEHYWAIFLKNCDQSSSSQREISLGGNRIFHLPPHLRFLATVNFDHTTEELSPRYLDRSWVIYLDSDHCDPVFDDDELITNVNNMIPYGSLAKAFSPKDSDVINYDVDTKWKTIQNIFAHKGAMPIAPRNLKMVHNYCKVACRCMDVSGISNRLAPLDYALSQKILPIINGSGENYQSLIEALAHECTEQSMPISAKHLKRMQRIAKNNMGFYQFFAR